MQIVFVNGDDRRELDVRVNNPSATVADLVQALDPTAVSNAASRAQAAHNYAPLTLMVGDRVVDPEFELGEAGLHEGVVVQLTEAQSGPWGAPPPPPPVLAERELAVVNGLDAGRRFPIAPGSLTIGRAAGSDILLHDRTISRRHARLDVAPTGQATICDLGSHNGTWVDGEPAVEPLPMTEGALVEVGSLQVVNRPVNESDKPFALDPMRHTNAAGTIPFNRPPRPAPEPPPADVTPPKAPDVNQSKVPLSLITIVAPLIFAGVMWMVMHSVQFLLFAGLSPVMAIGQAVDGKRRGKKTEKSERARYAKEMAEMRERLAERSEEERRRRAASFPDPAEVVRRVTLPSTTLWERRPAHPDFLRLRAGIGDVPWKPPVTDNGHLRDAPDELLEALEEAATLRSSPVPVDLQDGGVVGIVGDRAAALAMARSLLCQAAALHGPADMPVMVLASYEAASAWDWAKWLPHTRDVSGSGRMLSYNPEQSTRLVEAQLKAAPPDQQRRLPGAERVVGPTMLVVVDDESLTEGRRAPTRNLLRGEGGLVAGIVVASTPDRLPAVCTTVIQMTDADGQADLFLPQQGLRIMDFLATGMSDDVARDCARSMARFEDPELDIVGAGLPASIRLLPLLELEECTPEAVLARWKGGGVDPRPASPIGVGENGAFEIDFVADGPHGLVGGTTGAGKSELLRTMVAGLAASVDPDHLTFVLIDFKGGSAFDECSRLPHTVGMVTDLDEHLAERALRCLEAELKHRERVLRDTGAIDLPDYLRNNRGAEPMPRLLVIIDEFATLKAELPDFIDALVGVAQRGRSLGVHMLLATQRPQGAISENIKANTNMRIALRVQDKNDSVDVIDVPDAAHVPRTAPGRAYVRLGPGEVVAIQSALSTGSRNEAAMAHVDVAPFSYGPVPRYEAPPLAPTATEPEGPDGPVEETDLSVLVEAINGAFARTGRPAPRRPWPEPLPDEIDLDELTDQAIAAAGNQRPGFVPLAVADDPDAQTQYPVGWTPADGNLVAYGLGGSGTTTALCSVALGLARLYPPDEVHLYALDFGAGELGALDALPHVGAVILAGERERQTRLIRFLRSELDRRRELGSTAVRQEPMIVTLIDGFSPFAAEYNDLAGSQTFDAFTRVFADGAELGMYTIVAADRANAVPTALASLVRQRLALRLADVHDYMSFGIRSKAVPEMVPGRALIGGSGQVIQIGRPADGVAGAVSRIAAVAPAASRPPRRIETLATEVRLADLGATAQLQTRPWTIPVGLAEGTLGPANLVVYDGEHALVAGPARSGKSSALLTVAAACKAARPDVTVVAVAGPRSPLGTGDPLIDETVHPSAVGDKLAPLAEGTPGFVLVLVDDAEAIEDPTGVLGRLSTSDRPDLLFVAAGRNDGIRAGYSHWTRPLRGSKLGVLLRPNIDLDGDILGTQLPRRAPVAMVAGRGYVVNSGDNELAQIALPR